MLFNSCLLPIPADSEQENDIHRPKDMISADEGDNVTLHCFHPQEKLSEPIVWYKQKFGHEPRVMVTVLHEANFEKEFESPRFSIEKGKLSFQLKIAKVDSSDEAVYYCAIVKYLKLFEKGTFLSVKGKNPFFLN